MAFTSRLGLDITLDAWGDDPFRSLFNEELGAWVSDFRYSDSNHRQFYGRWGQMMAASSWSEL